MDGHGEREGMFGSRGQEKQSFQLGISSSLVPTHWLEAPRVFHAWSIQGQKDRGRTTQTLNDFMIYSGMVVQRIRVEPVSVWWECWEWRRRRFVWANVFCWTGWLAAETINPKNVSFLQLAFIVHSHYWPTDIYACSNTERTVVGLKHVHVEDITYIKLW